MSKFLCFVSFIDMVKSNKVFSIPPWGHHIQPDEYVSCVHLWLQIVLHFVDMKKTHEISSFITIQF